MVATADVVWSKEMGSSAFYLMCSSIKTRGSGVVSVFLRTHLSFTLLLALFRTHDSNEGIIVATARPSAFWLLPSFVHCKCKRWPVHCEQKRGLESLNPWFVPLEILTSPLRPSTPAPHLPHNSQVNIALNMRRVWSAVTAYGYPLKVSEDCCSSYISNKQQRELIQYKRLCHIEEAVNTYRDIYFRTVL